MNHVASTTHLIAINPRPCGGNLWRRPSGSGRNRTGLRRPGGSGRSPSSPKGKPTQADKGATLLEQKSGTTWIKPDMFLCHAIGRSVSEPMPPENDGCSSHKPIGSQTSKPGMSHSPKRNLRTCMKRHVIDRLFDAPPPRPTQSMRVGFGDKSPGSMAGRIDTDQPEVILAGPAANRSATATSKIGHPLLIQEPKAKTSALAPWHTILTIIN